MDSLLGFLVEVLDVLCSFWYWHDDREWSTFWIVVVLCVVVALMVAAYLYLG
jgi:hypothetical protein